MATKPTDTLEWATNEDADLAEYTEAQKKAGYTAENNRPHYNEWNFFRKTIHLWLKWLDSFSFQETIYPVVSPEISELQDRCQANENEIAELKARLTVLEN